MQHIRDGCSRSTPRHRFISARQYINKGLSVGYLRATLNLTICFRQVMLKGGAASLAHVQQLAPSRPTRLLD